MLINLFNIKIEIFVVKILINKQKESLACSARPKNIHLPQ